MTEAPFPPMIDVDEARRLIAEADALLIDVREPHELAATGRLAGAHHVPLGQLLDAVHPDSPTRDPAFRGDRPVILYCAAGARSGRGGQLLLALGYETVLNLGGFAAAAAGGYEVEAAE